MASTPRQRAPPQSIPAVPRERAGPSNRIVIQPVNGFKSQICREFSRLGKCQYGEKCKFLHQSRTIEAPVNKTTGASVKIQSSLGDAGHQHIGLHVLEGKRRPQSDDSKPSSSNVKKTLSAQPCYDWKDGTCKFGDRCKYSHEDTSANHAIENTAILTERKKRVGNEQARLAQVAARKRVADAKARLAEEAEKGKRRLAEEAARAREAKRLQAEREAALRQETRAKEEAARKVRIAEQEALRFEREATVTSQHVVLGSTLVTFSAGLEVQSLVSGFESCRLTIRNLPSDAKPQEILELFTQQGMSRHDVHILPMQRTNDSHLEARVITSASQGGVVAVGLDGIEFRDERLQFEVSEIVTANAMGESNKRQTDTLTITWFAPSASMVATYPSMDVARRKQQALDRSIVGGRRIKVEMNRPPPGQALRYYNPASVKITGIPMHTSLFDVSVMAETPSVRAIKSNTYDLQGLLWVLRQHLDSLPGIKITSFDKVADRDSEGIVTVKVRFENWEDANAARASLEGKRLRPEYPTFRLQLPLPLHFRSTIPKQQYEAQERLWKSLAEGDSDKGPRVHIDLPPAREVAIIRLSGDDKKLVGALKVRVETLVAGEKLDAACWHRSFLRPQGREFLAKVFSSTKVYVRSDFKTLSLRIYGEGKAKERARQMIEEEVARLALEEWTVLLKRQSVGYFVRKGLAALKEILGEDAVSLDLASTPCKLTIRGGEEARHALNDLMDQSLHDLDLGSFDPDNDICPICYDSVSNPLILGCKHVYCTACIRHYITSTSETKIFPLTCMGNEAKCKVPISIPAIQRFVPPQQFENLVNVAFSTYLDQHPQEFRYCTTPDCTQIYRANTKSMLKCPSCFAEVCSSCHEEAHEGMSCEDRRAQKAHQEEQLNDRWATMHGVKRCPSCLVYIEKIEGCNHMTCRCGAHICWICVRVFPGNQIYLHLGEAHGGAFDGDGERRNLDLRHALALQRQFNEEHINHGPRIDHVPMLPPRPHVQVPVVGRVVLPVEQRLREEERRAAERREQERREGEAAPRLAAIRQWQLQEQRRREEYQRQFNERQERAARELEERRRNGGGGCLIM